MSQWDIFYKSFIQYEGYKNVLMGLKNTFLIAVFGLLIGIVIGTIIASFKLVPNKNWFLKILEKIGDFYVWLFRGTPMVVQLLIMYFIAFPYFGIRIDRVIVAIIVFGLNSGAYVSEMMRGGILSVDSGQLEAGRSLGLNYRQTMFSVVIPQSIKNILPTLGNEFIALIKETSVVSFIAVVDLTKAFRSIADANYEYIIPYLFLAITYLIIVSVLSIIIKLVEKGLRKSDRRN